MAREPHSRRWAYIVGFVLTSLIVASCGNNGASSTSTSPSGGTSQTTSVADTSTADAAPTTVEAQADTQQDGATDNDTLPEKTTIVIGGESWSLDSFVCQSGTTDRGFVVTMYGSGAEDLHVDVFAHVEPDGTLRDQKVSVYGPFSDTDYTAQRETDDAGTVVDSNTGEPADLLFKPESAQDGFTVSDTFTDADDETAEVTVHVVCQ